MPHMFLRYFMDVFFIACGGLFLFAPACLGSVCPYFKQMRLEGVNGERLQLALMHRKTLENLPPAYGMVIGCASIGLALLCIFSTISEIILYTVLCIVMAVTLAVAYTRLRIISGRRVASLRARAPHDLVPLYMYVPTLISALALGTFTLNPATRISAILVAASSLTILIIAWRISDLPALISGKDAPVEHFVDDRLRTVRAVNLIGVASAPTFVFVSFTGFSDSVPHLWTFFAAWVAFCFSMFWQFRLSKRTPSAAELTLWSHGI